MKSITIPCECGRKHILSRNKDNTLKHEVDEEGVVKEKPKRKESLLDVIFGSDEDEGDDS
jgi:hypothetical protein